MSPASDANAVCGIVMIAVNASGSRWSLAALLNEQPWSTSRFTELRLNSSLMFVEHTWVTLT